MERIAEEEEKDNNLKIMDLRRELHCTTGPAGYRSATKGGDEKRMAWLERAWSGLLRARARPRPRAMKRNGSVAF